MRLETRIQKEIKFDRIKEQFGCGYYAVCCRQCCPCKLKSGEYNPRVYRKLMNEFEMEERNLFGAEKKDKGVNRFRV